MKTHFKLIVLSAFSVLLGRVPGCSTANSADAPEEMPSTLAILCKGAGVSLEDVRWRVQAGLDPDQAVQAAILQKKANEEIEAAKKAVSKRGAKAGKEGQPETSEEPKKEEGK